MSGCATRRHSTAATPFAGAMCARSQCSCCVLASDEKASNQPFHWQHTRPPTAAPATPTTKHERKQTVLCVLHPSSHPTTQPPTQHTTQHQSPTGSVLLTRWRAPASSRASAPPASSQPGKRSSRQTTSTSHSQTQPHSWWHCCSNNNNTRKRRMVKSRNRQKKVGGLFAGGKQLLVCGGHIALFTVCAYMWL